MGKVKRQRKETGDREIWLGKRVQKRENKGKQKEKIKEGKRRRKDKRRKDGK